MKILFSLFAVCMCGLISAQPLELKGLQLGVSTAADLKEKFPATRVYGAYARLSPSDHIEQRCGPVLKQSGDCVRTAIDEVRVAGGTGGTYTFDIIDSVIESIQVSFSANGYGTAAGALKTKYGSPTNVDNTPFQNRMGATFDNERLTWASDAGVISVSRRGAKIDESRLTMTSARYGQQMLDAQAEKIKKGAKEL